MYRLALALLVALAVGCATPTARYQQATARPAPMPPPVMTPGYSPGPGSPVYTPQGAGAYRGDPLPTRPVPRSPNKRHVQPEKDGAPGLWAADGAPQGARDAILFDVTIPYPTDAQGNAISGETEWCAKTLTAAAAFQGVLEQIEKYAPGARSCMAAVAYLHCAEWNHRWATRPIKRATQGSRPSAEAATAVLEYAKHLKEKRCRDVALEPVQNADLLTLFYRWNIKMKEFE